MKRNIVFAVILFFSFSVVMAETKKTTSTPIPNMPQIGYSTNFTAFSFLVGTGLTAPFGTLINHEKAYDRTQLAKVLTGVTRYGSLGLPAVYNQPKYESGTYFALESEKAYSDNIGYGISFTTNSVVARRQKVIRELLFSGYDVLSMPEKMNIYQEFSLMAMGSYHFLPKNQYDPYVKGRLGIAKAKSDDIHNALDFDVFRTSDEMTNGRALVVGLAAGLNYHLDEVFYTTIEFSYLKRYIKSDQFSLRTMDSWYVNIGAGLNFFDVYNSK